jgi:hypothetical protein
VEAVPALFVEVLGAHQQLADPVERIAFPATVLEGGLLDALAALPHSLPGEAKDVKRIDHDHHTASRSKAVTADR